jgi:hypothetical protein
MKNPVMTNNNTKTAIQIEEVEDIVSLLESSIWETTIRLLFKDSLAHAKDALLNNVGLPTDTRTGYIMYRQKVTDSLKSLYRRHSVYIPEWLED